VVLDVESLDSTVFRRMRATGERAISDFEVAATDALTRAACLRADLLLACSAADATELRAMVPDTPIEIVPNAVDVAFFDGLGSPPRRLPPIVTFTGLLAYWPNADACGHFVDEILPQLEARVGPVIFQIVGRVPPAPVVSRADGQRVRLAADVPDIRPWLAASDVIVVPLRAGSGTRVKILEAFAAGRPVVSTRIGCEGLDVEPGRHLLVADEPEAFAAATARVLGDVVLADRLTRHAGQLVRERFDERAVTETLRLRYRELGVRDGRPHPTRGVGA
jgi:polysaccharide biosynthesis protein PslH